MKRSRLDAALDLSPVEILGFLLVAMGVLCLLAFTCSGCGGSPFEVGLGAVADVPSEGGAPLPPPDAGSPEVLDLFPAREAGVDAPVPLEAAQAPDGGVPDARDAGEDRPEEQSAPEAAVALDAAPETASPPVDPACLSCSITCSSSQLTYSCTSAGTSFSCGHSSYVAGDSACLAAGACAVGGPCGLPGNPACWGGTIVYVRGPSCP